MDVAEVLAALQAQRARLRAAVDFLSDDREVTAEGWTRRDLVAHCIHWMTVMAGELGSQLEPPGYLAGTGRELSEDAWNATAVEYYRGFSFEEVVDVFDARADELGALVSIVGDAALAEVDSNQRVPGQPLWQVIGGESFLHWARHVDEIRS